MLLNPSSIAALIISISFAAGLNVYATIATLGILAHAHRIVLPQGLDSLANPWIIGIATLLFALEFFADKIPAFDIFWNAAHTFIRIPVAALLAYKASSHLSPELQLLATAGGAAISALTHTSKTAARTLVNTTPEPLSNIAVSTAEDFAAIGLTWLTVYHPYIGAGLAAFGLILLALSLRWITRRLSRLWRQRPAWMQSQQHS